MKINNNGLVLIKDMKGKNIKDKNNSILNDKNEILQIIKL